MEKNCKNINIIHYIRTYIYSSRVLPICFTNKSLASLISFTNRNMVFNMCTMHLVQPLKICSIYIYSAISPILLMTNAGLSPTSGGVSRMAVMSNSWTSSSACRRR